MSVRKFIYILLFCAPLCAFAEESSVTEKHVRVWIPRYDRISLVRDKMPPTGVKIRIWDELQFADSYGNPRANYDIWNDSVYQLNLDNPYYDSKYDYYAQYWSQYGHLNPSGGSIIRPNNVNDFGRYEFRLQLEYTGTPDWEFSHWQMITWSTNISSDTIDTIFNLETFEEYKSVYSIWYKYENVARFYIGGDKCDRPCIKAENTLLIPIFKKVTAVERVEMPSYSIADGRVICEEEFRIYDVVGRDVTQLNGSLRGIYILKAGKATTKIIVP